MRSEAGWLKRILYFAAALCAAGLFVLLIHTDVMADDSIPMYRLYTQSSGEHLFTSDTNERQDLVKYYDWKYEGIGWYAPSSGQPVYRLFNPQSGEHHYTMDAHEKDTLVNQYHWNNEGIGWYSDAQKRVPLYREFNPKGSGAGSHNYTTSTHEDAVLTQNGWKNEGVAWYGAAAGHADSWTLNDPNLLGDGEYWGQLFSRSGSGYFENVTLKGNTLIITGVPAKRRSSSGQRSSSSSGYDW